MSYIEELLNLTPKTKEVDWPIIEKELTETCFQKLESVEQNPLYHGEGNVLTHTKLVVEALVQEEEFWTLTRMQQMELFFAAVFHDFGKYTNTKLVDGAWTSPYHAFAGATMVRSFLWKKEGMSGDPQGQQVRETICTLIRYHMTPIYLLEKEHPEKVAYTIASYGELLPDFNWKMLWLLALADNRGRISPELGKSEEKLQYLRLQLEEWNCFEAPYTFASPFARNAYFHGRAMHPSEDAYNDSTCEVYLLSGLPGTGKDYYIEQHLKGLPVVCLDDIREEFHLSPQGNQSEVVQIAIGRAKQYLRAHESFIWNATSISHRLRQGNINLFHQYHASVHIVFLETSWETEQIRNKNRTKVVPDEVLNRMLSNLEPPLPDEAMTVEWICI